MSKDSDFLDSVSADMYNYKHSYSFIRASLGEAGMRSPRFNGPEYKDAYDHKRLSSQLDRIKHLMVDSKWRTLEEISRNTRDPVASISAQLRHLRKERFGSYTVERRPRGNRVGGLFEYRVIAPINIGDTMEMFV